MTSEQSKPLARLVPGGKRAARTKVRRRLSAGVRLVAALFLVGGLYAAVAPGIGQAEDTPKLSQEAQAGKQIYEVSCVTCHGRNAQGVDQRGPSLIGVGSAAVEFQVNTGRMPLARQEAQAERKTPLLTKDEAKKIGQYIQELGGGPQLPSDDELNADVADAKKDPKRLAEGGEQFRVNCVSCHAMAGGGGALSSGKYAPSLTEATARDMYAAMLTGPQNMPVFGNSELTPQDKANIIAYVETLHGDQDPGGWGTRPLRPGARGSGHLPGRYRRDRLLHAVDCGEVMSHDTLDKRDEEAVDVEDPRLTRFDLIREGARRDGVEIVHYAPRFAVRGTLAERRIERTIALMFMLVGLFATIFVVVYIWWPWKYETGSVTDESRVLSKVYTPLLGVSLGLALLFLGLAIIAWAKKLLPEEVSVQERHIGPSPTDEQKLTAAAIVNMGDELGVRRRPMLIGALALGSLPLTVAAIAPLVGGLIKSPHRSADGTRDEAVFLTTGWDGDLYNDGKPVYMARMDGTKIRPEEVSVGGQITVFPLIFNEAGQFIGATNQFADSPTLLIHLREADAQTALKNAKPINVGSQWGDLIAYTKICSHAGCPASLYEQQTNRLLCPCHQSQFQITDNARPIFGPASRALAQLPIDVDGDGYLFAKSDYKVPVGPGFWERP